MTIAMLVLGVLAVASGIAMEALRQAVIVPSIREGSAHSVGVSVFTLYVEAREYRDQCREHGGSLKWWRSWWVAHIVFMAAWVGLVVTWGASLT